MICLIKNNNYSASCVISNFKDTSILKKICDKYVYIYTRLSLKKEIKKQAQLNAQCKLAQKKQINEPLVLNTLNSLMFIFAVIVFLTMQKPDHTLFIL